MFQKFPAPGPVLRAPRRSVVYWLRCMALLSVCSGFIWSTTGSRAHHESVREKLQEWGGAVWGEPALRSRASGLCRSPCMAAWTGGLCDHGHLVGPELVMPKVRTRAPVSLVGESWTWPSRGVATGLVSFVVPSAEWQASAGICLRGLSGRSGAL